MTTLTALPNNGDKIVFLRKSVMVRCDFEGYDSLEINKVYTVYKCTRISNIRCATDFENWFITLEGMPEFGFKTDCFTELENYRKSKLDELLN